MKTNNEQTDTYLAEWLAGTISDSQLKQLVSETDYLAYIKLRDSIGDFQISDPDMVSNYSKIRGKIDASKTKSKPIVLKLVSYASIAAAILILFGVYHLLVFSNSETTAVGAGAQLTLADNSVVNLNSKSTLQYPTLFKYNRKIKLHGEAFFNVQKGSSFCVVTDNGSVEVLGTQFNVLARDGYFEVRCHEGRVKVSTNDKSFVLEKGDGVRLFGGRLENWTETDNVKPTWISGESTFKNAPFQIVIDQFESQYGYKMQFPKSLSHVKFSGTFPNKDIELALRSICLPLDLKYDIAKDRTIIISE